MNVVAIVNPASANGRTRKLWPHLEKAFQQAGLAVRTQLTQAVGDGTLLTQQALIEGADVIVSVGGDGTHNEVVNGFFKDEQLLNPNAKLGFISQGTGGDLIKTLNIPKDPLAAIQRISSGKSQAIDVGEARFTGLDGSDQHRYFINITDVGIGGAVVERANRSSKALGGKISFLLTVLSCYWHYQNQETRVVLDGKRVIEGKTNDVIVANGRFFGGGMEILPMAKPDDGVFDVLIMGDLTRGEVYRNIIGVYSGTHLQHPKLEHAQAKTVHVSGPGALLIDMDGELVGKAPIQMTLLPQAIQVLI